MSTTPLRLNINPQVECAETLASHFYTDPAVLVREKEKIFRRAWQLVGTVSQPCGEVNGTKRTIGDPESFFTVDIQGEPVVVTRDKSGTLAPSATSAVIAPDQSPKVPAVGGSCNAPTTAGPTHSMVASSARPKSMASSSSIAPSSAWCRSASKPGSSSSLLISTRPLRR